MHKPREKWDKRVEAVGERRGVESGQREWKERRGQNKKKKG